MKNHPVATLSSKGSIKQKAVPKIRNGFLFEQSNIPFHIQKFRIQFLNQNPLINVRVFRLPGTFFFTLLYLCSSKTIYYDISFH